MRVPPTRLSSVLAELSRLGTERSRHLTTQDVTSRVADVTSRVTSARTAIARLRSLYTRAKKVTDVIAIEEELSTREATLESLEAQQRALAQQTATASVTLYLLNRHAAPPPVHHRSGFIGGLENGWDAFVRAASWVATAAGAVLPFALVVLLIAVAGRFAWIRLRGARPATPGPES
jgi:chromosome segregation ATPase